MAGVKSGRPLITSRIKYQTASVAAPMRPATIPSQYFAEARDSSLAEMAGLDEDIARMPMGMHTVLSDGAHTLSAGQRQRLMIARALIGRPRILFFDEATSALDNETQEIVTRSTRKLNATRVVIAHRLSTIMQADRLIVLDGGRVAQVGAPAELMADADGVFRRLLRRQLK